MPVTNADPIVTGADCLARGDLAGAARQAESMLKGQEHPDALHLLALVRIRQDRHEEAAALLERSLAVRPGHGHVLLNLGKTRLLLNDPEAALAALAGAVEAEPELVQAWYELGELQQQLGRAKEAAASFARVLELEPDHLLAQLGLGVALKDSGLPDKAETLLADGVARAGDPRLKAGFAYNLAFAQYDQGKKQAALENFTLVSKLDGRASLDLTRADLLEELEQGDRALTLLQDTLLRDPLNGNVHRAYNDLLYRLGREEDFLKSYDRAPQNTSLQLGKAKLLLDAQRGAEAREVYAAILAREPDETNALMGLALALGQMGRHAEALAQMERIAPRFEGNTGFHGNLTGAALAAGDPQKAESLAARGLMLDPLDQLSLALLGSAWRLMGDERDEALTGYDDLIGIFDLEPPEGFSSMEDFNHELNDWLGRMHPETREPIDQSLRRGSQTRGHIFGSGHDLVERLKTRIVEGVGQYIAGLTPDAAHPFRGRVGQGFSFKGSWSSRLRDCGYHVNHIHPQGWISSCYYVGVPQAIENGQQGWIKFGQPIYDVGLDIRRAIKPKPGRLVLFPSYMWHGTVPFHDAQARTTIAFDALPR